MDTVGARPRSTTVSTKGAPGAPKASTRASSAGSRLAAPGDPTVSTGGGEGLCTGKQGALGGEAGCVAVPLEQLALGKHALFLNVHKLQLFADPRRAKGAEIIFHLHLSG